MENNSSVLDSDIVKVDKYEPHKIANGKNEVTFFVASDEVDLADLQRYRIQAQTDYLIAINGTNKDYDCLKLADNVILCHLMPLVSKKPLCCGCVSINKPAIPLATAARARTGINSRCPPDAVPCPPGSCTECVASKTTGQPVSRMMANARISETRLL